MAILGLDFGLKRIGVALAEDDGRVAVPLRVIERKSEIFDVNDIIALVKAYDVKRIVVGLPRSKDGSIGRQATEVLAFVETLSNHVSIPVDTWDERLSTVAAEALLLDAGLDRAKRKGRRDAMAATVILQGYLDNRNTPHN